MNRILQFIKKEKQTVILAGLLVLLVAAGYVNNRINTAGKESASVSNNPSENAAILPADDISANNDDALETLGVQPSVQDNFSQFRLDRQKARKEQIVMLDELSKDQDEAIQKEAKKDKLTLVRAMEAEVTLEGLLKAKGYEDVVVTVHPGAVNVVVAGKSIKDSDAAKILELVKRETREKNENIKIIPVEKK